MFRGWRGRFGRSLVLRFAVMSLLVVGVIGVILGQQLTELLRSQRMEAAHARALVSGRMLQHEVGMAAAGGEAGMPGEEAGMSGAGMAGHEGQDHAALAAGFRRHLEPAGIPEANLWTSDGSLMFTTTDAAPALRAPDKVADLRAVLASDQPVSELMKLDPELDHHDVAGTMFVTYMPVSLSGAGEPDAVVEMVQDYAPTAAAINDGLRTLALTLAGGLLGLYVLLIPIVAGASRRMRRLMAEQEEHVGRLEEAERVKNVFLEAVSHDMRTPLTVISGMLGLLHERGVDLSPEQRDELVERAHVNSARLERLLVNLLDVDRLTRGVVTASRQPVELDGVVAQALTGLDLEEHPLRIETQACTLLADAAQVERIVENLVSNAVKYTPSGTPIWVRLEPVDAGALLTVEDAGPGIPVDARDRVFEVFERANEDHHSPGTGVGLALVDRFARMHGGEAWVEDRTGGGASFRILLRHPADGSA